MKINKILKEQLELILPNEKGLNELREKTKIIVSLLENEMKRLKLSAEVFVGGSFAKRTLLKRDKYDIDIFVRFDWRLQDISDLLEKIIKKASLLKKFKFERLHGSRDYFRIFRENVIFEIIPVYKIKKPREARNVTDLSYFHVNYVKRKIKNEKLANEILLAKSFCQAQGIYGAESYINGFSGYGLECLIIYYKSFLKMLGELVKIKDRIILDPEKHYKNKNDVLFSLNEARLQSPIILVDPTWKERNVLAALNRESFKNFQESARGFLKRPSKKFFEFRESDIENLKKLAKTKKVEFVHIKIATDKQEGDIAGTKMKKFSKFFESELRKYFDINDREFSYDSGKESNFYLVVKPKKKIILFGPPVKMKEHAIAFRKRHRNVYEKDGKLYSENRINFSCKKFLGNWIRKNKEKMSGMGISGIKVL